MDKRELLEKANRIVSPYGLRAEIFEDILSVGVGGDERSYMPVINIIGKFPGYKNLSKISSEITNVLPVNRVTFQIATSVLL